MSADDAMRTRRTETGTALSVIVPTYREAENIPTLIERVDAVRLANGLSMEMLIVDDDSRDGSEQAVRDAGCDWVRLITRRAPRDLSGAVIDGLRLAEGDVLAVMDADLSHPPEALPEMLEALHRGGDFVIGSRYAAGGSTDADWSWSRRLSSRVATALARPFAAVKDPMSGFFAMRRETFARADKLDPIGYKIGLELLTKCRCTNVAEIPIYFADRRLGESKFCLREKLRYVRHIWRLLRYKYG